MLKKLEVSILILLVLGIFFESKCQEIRIDHIISVVSDIDEAVDVYKNKGFAVKKGRLHKNGLINAHIKFKNNTLYELMSVKGQATDEMAKNYLELLNNGEGGVFVAISGIKTSVMKKKLLELKINHKVVKGKNWDYITFPKTSGLAHFFFIDMHIQIDDSPGLFMHKNGSDRILEVFVEGDHCVVNFLKGMGVEYSGKVGNDSYGEVKKFRTKTGDIIIVPREKLRKRPRIVAISFSDQDNRETYRMVF